MSNKKDLTRIEDLGEFIHALDLEETEEAPEEFSSDLPDLPSHDQDEEPDFNFASYEESSGFSEETQFDSVSEIETDSESEPEVSFGTDDFTATFDRSILDQESEPETEFEASNDAQEDLVNEASAIWNVEEPLATASVSPEVYEAPTPYTPDKDFKTPETFEDLKKFSESTSFSGMAAEGNPSFSVLIKNVRYIEDVNDILALLRELTLMSDTEENIKGRLMRGMLLVPRISEYSAIFLAHKLRRFDVDIQVGLSDEIHPPKHQETPETGIVSKSSLYQNQAHHFHFDDPKLELAQIIVAATPSLEGHQVIRYMGVASEHKMLESHVVEDEGSSEVPHHYQELAQKLKAHALKANANAVVGLNYQLTPIPSEYGVVGHKYRLTCTGNLVWVNKL